MCRGGGGDVRPWASKRVRQTSRVSDDSLTCPVPACVLNRMNAATSVPSKRRTNAHPVADQRVRTHVQACARMAADTVDACARRRTTIGERSPSLSQTRGHSAAERKQTHTRAPGRGVRRRTRATWRSRARAPTCRCKATARRLGLAWHAGSVNGFRPEWRALCCAAVRLSSNGGTGACVSACARECLSVCV